MYMYNLVRYGVVLRELEAVDEARKMLLRATHLSPLLWSAWKELGKLCEDREMVCVCVCVLFPVQYVCYFACPLMCHRRMHL